MKQDHGVEYYRGDIFYVTNLGSTAIGSEQMPGRPAIIVSNNANNAHSPTVTVVYVTSKPKKDLPTHVQISCKVLSTALCETISTISKDRLGDYIRSPNDKEMEEIDHGLSIALSLTDIDVTQVNRVSPGSYRDEIERYPFKSLIEKDLYKYMIERNMYQSMYEDLLLKVLLSEKKGE